ncbi:MAG: Ig-like domain-containing protein, partial [Saprospiraceae bacterium]
ESDDANHEKDMRENILPILELFNIDLVLYGHTHNYQRSFLVKNHYGPSNTFDPLTMTVDDGSGVLAEEAPYVKLNEDKGAVFICLGNAAKEEGEPEEDLQHPTTFIGRDLLGSAALEINGPQLDFKFILQDGTIEDHFTILKEVNPLTVSINSPLNNAHFPTLQNITISASADDPEGSVTQVAFYLDGNLIHSDLSYPYTTNWHPLHAGSYTIKAVATDNEGFTKSATHYITVGQTTNACALITQETDDAEQRENGSINLTSGDLELVTDGNSNQVVGLRFNNLMIPRGAAISEAHLNFKVKDNTNENPCLLNIFGQTGNNTTTFSANENDISNRPKTNNSLTWNPNDWGQQYSNQSSVDIGAILQEIVLQDNYLETQSIVLIIEGVGSRRAISFDQGDGSNAPELCVIYDANNCLDSDFDGVCDIDDVCPGAPDPGQFCNDNNPGTFNDVVASNCICKGTSYDCPDLQAQIGWACNDGNNGTFDDKVNANCECVGIPYDCPNLQLQFGTACNDNNSGTFDDLITEDCECEGTPYDCPDLQLQFGTPCNDNNVYTCHDVITQNCECAGTSVQDTQTLTSQIDQSSDDAEEKSDGSVSTTSSDLELIYDKSDQIIGLRFNNPGIPTGTLIEQAYIQFTVDENENSDFCELIIFGERSTSAATFSSNANNISTRVKTNASVSWSPEEWEDVGDQTTDQRTPNLAAVLQEIINLNGYQTSSPFSIVIEGEGKRVAVSHDKSSQDAPILYITYSSSLDDEDGDGICDDEDQCFGAEPGSPCNDNNALTYNDMVDANCNCQGTLYDCPTLLSNIGAACDDGNANTFNDFVNSNCDCVGSLFQCPEWNANIGDSCNDGNPLTTNDIVNSNCDCIGQLPVLTETCIRISNNTDDAEEKSNGSCSFGSSDLELVSDKGDIQLIGLRFRNIGLQSGSIIESAFVQFTVDKTNNINPCQLMIRGELRPNPETFTSSKNDISDRPLTNASVSWSPEEWENNGDAGTAQLSTDIGSILQELVNQEGFDENSAMVLVISGEGLRQAVSFDESEEEAPELCINNYEPQSSATIHSDITKPSDKTISTPLLSEIKVYPNPAKTELKVAYHTPTEGMTLLRITAPNGQLLSEQLYRMQKGENRTTIDVSNLPNGVYFLTLCSNLEHRIAKFHILK